MELVTGHLGVDHISAADMASLYRGALVADDVVLADGSKLSCTMTDANTAEIAPGCCLIQGHLARVETAEQLAVESGSVGYKRNDLVVVRYELGTGNVQSATLAIVKGTPTTQATATDPTLTEGDIDGGDVLCEFPLWRIPLDGVSVGDPERVMPTIDTLQDQITSLGETLSRIHYGTDTQSVKFDSGVTGAGNQVSAQAIFYLGMTMPNTNYTFVCTAAASGGQTLTAGLRTRQKTYVVVELGYLGGTLNSTHSVTLHWVAIESS